MPQNKKTGSGTYDSKGLTEKQFIALFNQVQKEQNSNRKDAKRTLTPGILSRKSPADMVKLGVDENGIPFTPGDLKRFHEQSKSFTAARGKVPGISYNELIGNARHIDIKRASNRSHDDLDIHAARFLQLQKGNVGIFQVKASKKSKHEHHRVKIRFEAWHEHMSQSDGTTSGYKNALQSAVRDNVSIDCDCGRHQYWYRYMASVGNYQIGPFREVAFPKVRNQKLTGTACKHVILCVQMLQSPAWQRPLAILMEKQANNIGLSGANRGSTKTFKGTELKKDLARNRSTTISDAQMAKAQKAFKRIQDQRAALSTQMSGPRGQKIKDARQQSTRIKTLQKRVGALERQKAAAVKNLIKERATAAMAAYADAGITPKDALKKYATRTNISVATLEKVLKQ